MNITSEYSEDKTPKFLGYQVFQGVSITLTDLSKYENLLTGAIQAGVNGVNGISFQLADPPKYREQARLNAVKAAQEKAKAIAAELGQTVGKPWEVTEDPNYGTEANYLKHGPSNERKVTRGGWG